MAYFMFFSLVLTFICHLGSSSPELSPSVDVVLGKTAWSNYDDPNLLTVDFFDGSIARFIVLKQIKLDTDDSGYGFGFCFYCNSSKSDTCYVAVVFVEISNNTVRQWNQFVVWLANRDKPVGQNATLEFDDLGNLAIIDDAKGGIVWSTETGGYLVSKMRIIHNGNLVLIGSTGEKVWQSFLHLTDTLLDGQVLTREQRLTSRVRSNDLSSGLIYLVINATSLSAYAKSGENPTKYFSFEPLSSEAKEMDLKFVEFRKANLSFYYSGSRVSLTDIDNSSDVQIMKLDSDGGLRIHGWSFGRGWRKVHVFLSQGQDECGLPLKCGSYGVCGEKYSCTCPVSIDNVQHFRYKDSRFPEQGCLDTQGTSNQYQLVNFGHISYFSFFDKSQVVPGLEDEDSCAGACKNDTFCMAAFFVVDVSIWRGYCILTEEVLSLIVSPLSDKYYWSSHIKVQIQLQEEEVALAPAPKTHNPKSDLGLILVACFASLFVALVLIIVLVLVWRKKRLGSEKGLFEQVISSKILIKRFSCQELCASTSKFSEKLGQGGFGSVFKGVLDDGRVIAVKKLETKQGTKEFLAEIETLGNIHHINLVRLIGFCVDRKKRMLVYEYMSNGSLDKWIFRGNRNEVLPWNIRKKIVLDVAKGLAYLHDECRYKIAHLDVKPHNILIDDDFNAKISDFGLSKLISRDESQVVTEARGTLGYLAPEWKDSLITVKADVYSFGIVVLEIVCGRKVLDHSQPNSDVHLRTLLGKKASEKRLKEMVDSRSEDMQNNGDEVVQMMKLGIWCSEDDFNRRPSMSTVVKILEGGLKNQIRS